MIPMLKYPPKRFGFASANLTHTFPAAGIGATETESISIGSHWDVAFLYIYTRDGTGLTANSRVSNFIYATTDGASEGYGVAPVQNSQTWTDYSNTSKTAVQYYIKMRSLEEGAVSATTSNSIGQGDIRINYATIDNANGNLDVVFETRSSASRSYDVYAQAYLFELEMLT